MLTLRQFAPAFGVPNASPYCMKLETFLRLAGISYRTVPIHDLEDAPKKKAPWVEIDGEPMGDSELIMLRLEVLHGIDLDAGLDPFRRAAGHALCTMLEERTGFAIMYARWIDEPGWTTVRDTYLSDLPPAVQDMIRDGLRDRIVKQGLGQHSRDEIYRLAAHDIGALAGWLGDKPYLMGERPTRSDCAGAAFAANLLCSAFPGPLLEAARAHPHLARYADRMIRRVFPETYAKAA